MSKAPLHVLPPRLDQIVDAWLAEDIPGFEIGAHVVGDSAQTANLLAKSPGVVAGRPFVDAIFQRLGCTVEWTVEEGQELTERRVVAHVTGPVFQLLRGERLALNTITRASGIATAARRVATLAADAGWHGEVAGTRKTTPGFRLAEKYALLVGGASAHRMDLSGMVMLKDNHVWATGGIAASVKRARQAAGFSSKIEVECRSLEEACEAAEAGADVCMLDNFAPEDLHETARRLKEIHPHVLVEGSGGIREETISAYFGPHIDVLSLGSLTQGYSALDFSMKLPRPSHMA